MSDEIKNHVTYQDRWSKLQIQPSICPTNQARYPIMESSITICPAPKANQSTSSSDSLGYVPLPIPITTALVQVKLFSPANIYWHNNSLLVSGAGLGTVNLSKRWWLLPQKCLNCQMQEKTFRVALGM